MVEDLEYLVLVLQTSVGNISILISLEMVWLTHKSAGEAIKMKLEQL